MRYIYNRKGFTLIECILVLALFSIVLTATISLYLAGYKMYRRQEYRVEVEQNILVVLNRISETLRRTDNLEENIYVSDKMLIIGNTRYYIQGNSIYERIGFGTNNLGENISQFEPRLDNGYLSVKIEGIGYKDDGPISIKQIFLVGGG